MSGVERVRGEPKRLARCRSSLGTELPSARHPHAGHEAP